MELTFVHQYSGDAPKRRRLAKACESCRQRKKRCIHFAGAEDDDSNGKHQDEGVALIPGGPTPREATSYAHPSEPRSGAPAVVNGSPLSQAKSGAQHHRTPSEASRGKFISDFNPVTTLLNRPPPAKEGARKQPNDDIGIWVDRKKWDELITGQHRDGTALSYGAFRHAQQRPHSAVLGPLIDIYFEKVHPILPLMDEEEFRRNHVSGVVPEALVHAMCLTAAKDASAEPHLRLSDSASSISTRQFCTVLHASVAGALRVPVRFEKITLIRILALTSLHVEGPEGAEEASIWLSQAMHYGQTLGIHLGQQAAIPAGNDLLTKRLFWVLWMLDRTNAAVNGRPLIMADQDIAIENFAPGESGFPAFEAWLAIAHVLNKIIGFYRPAADVNSSGWEGDYPPLEGMIDAVGGWHLSASCLATIHLFYLSVGLLSHRTRGIRELPEGTASYIRQRLFAVEILRLMNAPKSTTLHPLPILPYAISLAMSVSYQHLRQSQLEHQQADARQDFRTCCRILQNLRRTWCSADVMAGLAKKVLEEMDRAPDLASFRIRRVKGGPGGVVYPPAGELIPPPTVCDHRPGDVKSPQLDTPGVGGAPATQNGAMGMENGGEGGTADGLNIFDNMDDVFGTFMDPNYPLNLDDVSFVDDLTPWDWNLDGDVAAGTTAMGRGGGSGGIRT